MFAFNGREFRFEVEDYDDLSRFYKALETLGNEEAELVKSVASKKSGGGFSPEFIRDYCRMVSRFFDAVLGEGTAETMFGGRMNMGACEEAYIAFVEFVGVSVREAAQARIKRRERLRQYLPASAPNGADAR